MTFKTALVASALALLVATAASAQQQTGEIYGRAADKSGAVLPGATVTIAGPALIAPRVAVTSETGTYRAPELPIGTYSVTFELPGFHTMVMQDIRVTIGFRAQVNGTLELSSVQETVTVTGESPIVDTRETGTSTTFNLETMRDIPSARDALLVGVLRATGMFDVLLSTPEHERLRARIDQLADLEEIGRSLNHTVAVLQMALAAAYVGPM